MSTSTDALIQGLFLPTNGSPTTTNGSTSNMSGTMNTVNVQSRGWNPPPLSGFESSSLNGQAFSCLDSSNYPVLAPKYTLPQELLLSPTKARVNGGSVADSITDGKAPIGKTTPPPQPSTPSGDLLKKPLYYEMCLSLTDFIKSVYGIVGPTSGKGRDIGTSSLTKEQRLRNRQALYKNISPLTPGAIDGVSSPTTAPPAVKGRRPLLVLDLDETLVHAFIGLKSPLPNSDAHVEITTTLGVPPRKSVNAMYIRYRPYISEFMSAVAPLFDVVLFTAARPIYADTLMNVMDPKGTVIGKTSRYFRDTCTDIYNRYEPTSAMMSPKGSSNSSSIDTGDREVVDAVAAAAGCDTVNGLAPLAEPGFVRSKDLTKMGRPLDEIILVDNTPTCGLLQPRNLLPISSWFGTDMKDDGLRRIIPVLKKIAATRDVYGCLDEYCASIQPVV